MTFTRGEAYVRHSRRRRSSAVVVHDRVEYRGGLNLIDSADRVSPGELQFVKNYEPNFLNGAYTRIQGYERFDGRPRPHLAEYWKVDLTDIGGGPYTVGETVTAAPSGATAEVALYYPDTENNDDSGYLIVTELTEQVDLGEVWTGGTSGATGTGADSEYGGEDDEDLHDAAQLAAEGRRRTDITTVGDTACTGPVRGVWVYQDEVYAFRDTAEQDQGTMWKATASGWDQIDLGVKIRFNTGTTRIEEGDTITGVASGASVVARRVVVLTGFYGGGDAAGYIVTDSVTGGPFAESEILEVDSSQVALSDASTAQESQTLPVGGSYRFRNHNFGGHTRTERMYGCNGEGNAFEFDGTYFTLIETGMTTDTPEFIGVHRGHLLLAFSGGSLQHSAKNSPLSWNPIFGANELLAGDEITGIMEEVRDVTFVFTRNQTFRLEGFVQENIQLKLHSFESGAIPNSVQRIGMSTYLDDRGFTSLSKTDQFGDFGSNQISTSIDPLIQKFLINSEVDASVIHRGKSLYRCFFSNGEAIVIGFSGNQLNGITTIDYGLEITCAANGEIRVSGTNNGEERVFVGTSTGYVMETDVGRNFDGAELEAYIVPHYHHSRSPEYNMRYRRCTMYVDGNGRTTLQIFADYDYNEDAQNFEEVLNNAIPLGGGRYGIARHDDFNYSSASKTDLRFSMNSHARNVSLIVYHKETNEEPHTLHGVNYHASRRRMIRE